MNILHYVSEAAAMFGSLGLLCLLITSVVLLVYLPEHLRSRKLPEQGSSKSRITFREAPFWVRNQFNRELQSDADLLRNWDIRHRWGPSTAEERQERDELVMNVIASRMLAQCANGEPMFDGYMNHLLNSIEDWTH